MDIKDVTTIIQTVGFPIFVCVWFLIRTERKIERMSESNTKLATALTVLAKTFDLSEADQLRVGRLLGAEEDKDGS